MRVIAHFLIGCVWLLASAFANEQKPNVLFIITDDQGWFDLGCHDNPYIETPVLDRLARESVEFTRFYATPVCTPTRAGLMTGRYFQRTRAVDTYMGRDVLSEQEMTLPTLFKKLGYNTVCVGKWHLGRYAKYHPNSRGFDEFFGFWQYGFINRYMDSDELWHNRKPVQSTGYITDVLTDAAIGYLSRNRQKSFFLYLPYNAPHDPHLVPDAYIARYLKKGLPISQARIYGMISSLDENIGRLLKTIDEFGLRKNTIVIFMTDNGGVSTFHKSGLRANKGTVYEGGIRVPLFVRWPGKFPAGAKIESMAQYVDLFPTLCDLIGAQVPTDRKIDGKTLVPRLRTGAGASPHKYLFQQWTRVQPDANTNWMARDSQFKLVNGQLYDLKNDPSEERDLAGQMPEKVRELRGEFERWFSDVTAGVPYAERVPIQVGREDENPVELDVTWASAKGTKVKPTYARYIRDTIQNWTEPGDSVFWKIEVVRAGRYEVVLNYGCAMEDAGSKFSVRAGESRVGGITHGTPVRDVFRPHDVGALDLKQGPAILEIKPGELVGKELMVLRQVWLRRIDP